MNKQSKFSDGIIKQMQTSQNEQFVPIEGLKLKDLVFNLAQETGEEEDLKAMLEYKKLEEDAMLAKLSSVLNKDKEL